MGCFCRVEADDFLLCYLRGARLPGSAHRHRPSALRQVRAAARGFALSNDSWAFQLLAADRLCECVKGLRDLVKAGGHGAVNWAYLDSVIKSYEEQKAAPTFALRDDAAGVRLFASIVLRDLVSSQDRAAKRGDVSTPEHCYMGLIDGWDFHIKATAPGQPSPFRQELFGERPIATKLKRSPPVGFGGGDDE